MKMLKYISFVTIVTCHYAAALPDTNIQIQHYDGPIYMATPNPDYCPFCNSLLKPQTIDNAATIDHQPIDIVYPQTITFGITKENEPTEKNMFDQNVDKNECEKSKSKTFHVTVNTSEIPVCENVDKITGNVASLLHTDPKTRSIHNVPVTCQNTGLYGNTGTGNANTYNYGTGINTPNSNWPLSSYLPINTATQNTCYQLPVATTQEQTLVPQKFMYSLILDGDVAPNQNGYDSKYYYY